MGSNPEDWSEGYLERKLEGYPEKPEKPEKPERPERWKPGVPLTDSRQIISWIVVFDV
jgi:hypothetical protein